MTIDPNTPEGAETAFEEILFLAERLKTDDLRRATNALLVLTIRRAIAATRRGYNGNAGMVRAERVLEDFISNVGAALRSSLETDGPPRVASDIPAREIRSRVERSLHLNVKGGSP